MGSDKPSLLLEFDQVAANRHFGHCEPDATSLTDTAPLLASASRISSCRTCARTFGPCRRAAIPLPYRLSLSSRGFAEAVISLCSQTSIRQNQTNSNIFLSLICMFLLIYDRRRQADSGGAGMSWAKRHFPNWRAAGPSSPAGPTASAGRSPPRSPASRSGSRSATSTPAASATAAAMASAAFAVAIDVRKRESVTTALAEVEATHRRLRPSGRQRRRFDDAACARPHRRGMGLQFRRQRCAGSSSPIRSPRAASRPGPWRHRQHGLARRQSRRAVCSPIIPPANLRCSAGRRRLRASWRRRAFASMPFAPAL